MYRRLEQKIGRANTRVGLVFATFFVLIVGGLVAGAVFGSSQNSAGPQESVASQLATVQSGSVVLSTDALVAQFQKALDDLHTVCTNDDATLAGAAQAMHDDMLNHGISESELSIMQHVYQSVPATLGQTDCRAVYWAYSVLREKG